MISRNEIRVTERESAQSVSSSFYFASFIDRQSAHVKDIMIDPRGRKIVSLFLPLPGESRARHHLLIKYRREWNKDYTGLRGGSFFSRVCSLHVDIIGSSLLYQTSSVTRSVIYNGRQSLPSNIRLAPRCKINDIVVNASEYIKSSPRSHVRPGR